MSLLLERIETFVFWQMVRNEGRRNRGSNKIKVRGKGHSKKRERHHDHDESLPALATYLPTSPSTAKSRTQRRRGGRGGSPISRPVLFLLRTCADVRFSVQMPPKPAGDLKIFRARAREPPPRAARTTANPPKCHKTAALGCRWPQNGGVPIFLVTFSRAPAYLPTCHGVSSRFF